MVDFTDKFPTIDSNMKIKSDLDNRKHGIHYDVLVPVSDGTDQVRVTPAGNIIEGTTNIGKVKMKW